MSRYIDADALKKAFVKPMNDFATGANNSLEIGEIIDAQPTADVVEVVHGEWITRKNSQISCNHLITNYECSVCHTWCRYHSNYCPDCGAKMGLKEVEE